MTKTYRPIPAEEMLADVSAERREGIKYRARELIAEQGITMSDNRLRRPGPT